MANEKKDIQTKEYLQKMVQHYANGELETAKEYLGLVLTHKANKLFNESKVKPEEEDKEKEAETNDKEKQPKPFEKKDAKASEKPEKASDSEKEETDSSAILAKLKAKHEASDDKDAFCKKVAKAAGMEACTSGDFAKAAKALHANGKHKGL